MRPSLLLLFFSFVGLFQPATNTLLAAPKPPRSSPPSQKHDQPAPSSAIESTVTIPGPLRSFLRMSGISQYVSAPEVLPLLSHTVVLRGYEIGHPTEFEVLLRRYVHQARELTALASADGNIRVNSCKDADPLLHILGYRIQGECGQSSLTLVTADAERAFLTVDSGFPFLDLEEALQHGKPFVHNFQGSTVPLLFTQADWLAISTEKGQENRDFLDCLLYQQSFARLYWAMSRIEPETRALLKKDIGLAKLLPVAATLDLYGSQFCIRDGAVLVPGGRISEKEWQDLVGASPKDPAEFIPQLLAKDHGWLATYFDALARTSHSQQDHFAQNQRLKRYYAAYRSPGISDDASTRLAFRPAPVLILLVARMQWDANGDPYVPGNLQAWSEILRQKEDSRQARHTAKRSTGWKHPDQLAEAMFTFSRLETNSQPLQAYLFLSELDHRRPPEQRLSNQTVILLAEKFPDYSGQYLVFSEFPELNDESITHFLTTAESINKISNSTLRGNAMGIFQANVGLWQILARQGEIDRAQMNSSWREVIKPFTGVSSAPQLLTAGRASLDQIFRAATGTPGGTQDEIINLLAGSRQRTDQGREVHTEIANRIRAVLEDQRLVSIDTLFALDDGLKNPPHSAARKDELVALAGELHEFEMPQPIFTNSERTRWATGTYNNRHTETQMRADIAKVVRSPESPKQVEAARGQLATFLRDTLVGMNYAYYEPPGSQVLHNNPLFVRSHDFSGETVMGVERLWQPARIFGEGSPAGGGAHLIGSLADLPYVLAETEQDFIAPDHVQALIWQQFVPGLLSNAVVPRWWNVSRKELHAVALYQRAGEELLLASSSNSQLNDKVISVLSDRMYPEQVAWLQQMIHAGKAMDTLGRISPADTFYLTAGFRKRFPGELESVSASGKDLEALSRDNPEEVSFDRLSRDFGVIHPVLTQNYGLELISVRPFPAMGGNYSRLMSESWDSGNLYWARLADEMGYDPVLLNRLVPGLTRRMVERIFASEIEDWPATIRALRETGEEFRQKKISVAGIADPRN